MAQKLSRLKTVLNNSNFKYLREANPLALIIGYAGSAFAAKLLDKERLLKFDNRGAKDSLSCYIKPVLLLGIRELTIANKRHTGALLKCCFNSPECILSDNKRLHPTKSTKKK